MSELRCPREEATQCDGGRDNWFQLKKEKTVNSIFFFFFWLCIPCCLHEGRLAVKPTAHYCPDFSLLFFCFHFRWFLLLPSACSVFILLFFT